MHFFASRHFNCSSVSCPQFFLGSFFLFSFLAWVLSAAPYPVLVRLGLCCLRVSSAYPELGNRCVAERGPQSPISLFLLFANTIPIAGHVCLTTLPLQWTTYARSFLVPLHVCYSLTLHVIPFRSMCFHVFRLAYPSWSNLQTFGFLERHPRSGHAQVCFFVAGHAGSLISPICRFCSLNSPMPDKFFAPV